MARSALPAADLARVVVFAAFIAVLGVFPGIPVSGPVAIVLQNIGPLLAGLILGWKRGTAAVVLFLAVTALGLPLLSGGRGGLAPFVGPSAGFLVGWILSALVAGLIVERLTQRRLPMLLLASFLGMAVSYVPGVPVYGFLSGAFSVGVYRSLFFIPGDLLKVAVAAVIAGLVHRALPDLLPARRDRVS